MVFADASLIVCIFSCIYDDDVFDDVLFDRV
jgi:hypothetical protein